MSDNGSSNSNNNNSNYIGQLKRDRDDFKQENDSHEKKLQRLDFQLPSHKEKQDEEEQETFLKKNVTLPASSGKMNIGIGKPTAATSKSAGGGGFGVMKFNITTKPIPSRDRQDDNNNNNNDNNITIIESKLVSAEETKPIHKEKEEVEEKDKNQQTTKIGPPSSMVGPPRPPVNKKNNKDDSDSDSSSSSSSDDSSDSDDENNKNVPTTTSIKVGPSPMVGPPRPPVNKKKNDGDDDSDSDSDSDSSSSSDSEDSEKEEINRWVELSRSIPISHEVVMKCHDNAVSSVALDPSGSRLLTGSFDCKVRFWDFNGMDSNLRSFREVQPVEGTQIRSILYSPTGDRFMALPYTVQMKLYDRDGFSKAEFVSGDRYIQDLNHTKGHVSTLTSGCWHPNEKDHFISSSLDSTIRVWDVNQPKKNLQVIKSRNTKGAKIGITTCGFDIRGDVIVGGCQDGSIIMFDQRSTLAKPKNQINDAHSQMDITSIQSARDGYSMISRGMDSTIKVWDLRMLVNSTAEPSPVVVWDDITTDYLESNVVLGSYDRLIVAGTSMKETSGSNAFGSLVIFDRTSLTKMRQIKIDGASCINVAWNSKINQILIGCSDGQTRIYYDPNKSEKGIRLCVNKAPRKRDPSDFEPDRPIITPFALPLYREQKVGKKKSDQKGKKKPEVQAVKESARGPNLTQHLVRNTTIANDSSWKQDAREAFLSKAQELNDSKK